VEFIDNLKPSLSEEEKELLYHLAHEFNFHPGYPEGMESYLVGLLAEGRQSGEELEPWLRRRVAKDFRCLNGPPEWIQAPAWPLSDGKPMIFVGQVDVARDVGIFHDDSSFYVFVGQDDRETETIIQVY